MFYDFIVARFWAWILKDAGGIECYNYVTTMPTESFRQLTGMLSISLQIMHSNTFLVFQNMAKIKLKQFLFQPFDV